MLQNSLWYVSISNSDVESLQVIHEFKMWDEAKKKELTNAIALRTAMTLHISPDRLWDIITLDMADKAFSKNSSST